MAEMTGWPTDGAEGSVSSEARWRAMAKHWAPSGVVSGMVPSVGAGVINVTAGAAWVDGHYAELASPASESSTANGLLVVRFTPADNEFELVYRDGITTPTQSDAVWELPIAQMTAGVMADRRRLMGGGVSAVLGFAQITAGHNGIGATVTDINGLTVTVSVPPSRRIKLTGQIQISKNTSAATVTGDFREGSTDIGRYVRVSMVGNEPFTASGFAVLTPTAGLHTYKMSISTGTGTVDAQAAASVPGMLLVEDIGAA